MCTCFLPSLLLNNRAVRFSLKATEEWQTGQIRFTFGSHFGKQWGHPETVIN